VITHPKTEELVESVALWLEQIRPSLDPRNAFLSRVAVNALRTVGREVTVGPAADAEGVRLMSNLLGHQGSFADLTAELCERIRAGGMTRETSGLLPALHAMAMAQLAIDQPSYKPEGTPPPAS